MFVATLFFKPFFGNWDGFKDACADAFSLFSASRWVDCEWSDLKLKIWLLLSFGCGLLAYHNLPEWFPKTLR